jgi:hypothetical protein
MVTVTGNFGLNNNAGHGNTFGNIYNQSLTVSGASDPNYNGTFPVTVTGPSSFTYVPAAAPSSSTASSLTVTECNCSFTLYPRAEVLSVYNSGTKQVDGTLVLEPNTIPFSTGDTIEEPHWHMPLVNDTHNYIHMFATQAGSYGRGYSYNGIVTGGLYGFDLRNTAPMAEYQGYGGWRSAPNVAYHINGWWGTSLLIDSAPNANVFQIGCKPDITTAYSGCASWNAAYNLFSLTTAGGGTATVGFNPSTSNYSFGASGSPCSTTIGSSVGAVGGASEGGMAVTSSYSAVPCALFASGLVVGGNSAASALTGVQGTGTQIVTNSSPTIASATLTGTAVIPTGATLTIAGSVNITGSCTGCGSVSVPGTSGQLLTSNGSSGFGAPLGSTGSGSIMLAGSPTTTGTLTAGAINASSGVTAASLTTAGALSAGAITGSGTLSQSGVVSINTSANSGNIVNINTGSGSGAINLGFSGNNVSIGGGMYVNGVTSNGDTVYAAQGTSTASTGPYNSYYWTEQANYWNPVTSSVCGANLSPYTTISATRFALNWQASGRTICAGYSGAIISDFSAFLDGMKVTHILTTQSTSPANVVAPPAAVVGDGAGSGSVTVSTSPMSTDMRGVLTVVVSGSPSANAAIATLTFNDPYTSAPICWAVPGSANAIGTFYVPPSSMTATGFAIYSGGTALTAGTYVYTYGCN